MRLKATNPFKGEDGLKQQSHCPQVLSRHRWGWTILQERFNREGERINGLIPVLIIVMKLQGGSS